MGGCSDDFPSTHWSKVAVAGDSLSADQITALNYLIERYGKPVYYFVRRRGYGHHDASDLSQTFFER